MSTELKAFVLKNDPKWGLPQGWGNGYVAIPKGHPCHGIQYMDIEATYDINVNGGLTFSASPKQIIANSVDLAPDSWIVGFDTRHHWDNMELWPDEERVMMEANSLKDQLEKIAITATELSRCPTFSEGEE